MALGHWPRLRMLGAALAPSRLVYEATLASALSMGTHIHQPLRNGDIRCAGGDPNCPLWGQQLQEMINAASAE